MTYFYRGIGLCVGVYTQRRVRSSIRPRLLFLGCVSQWSKHAWPYIYSAVSLSHSVRCQV